MAVNAPSKSAAKPQKSAATKPALGAIPSFAAGLIQPIDVPSQGVAPEAAQLSGLAQLLTGKTAGSAAPSVSGPRAKFLDALLGVNKDKSGAELDYTGSLQEKIGGGLRDGIRGFLGGDPSDPDYAEQIKNKRRAAAIEEATASGDIDALQRLDPRAAAAQLGVDSAQQGLKAAGLSYDANQFELSEARNNSADALKARRLQGIQSLPEAQRQLAFQQVVRNNPNAFSPVEQAFAKEFGTGALGASFGVAPPKLPEPLEEERKLAFLNEVIARGNPQEIEQAKRLLGTEDKPVVTRGAGGYGGSDFEKYADRNAAKAQSDLIVSSAAALDALLETQQLAESGISLLNSGAISGTGAEARQAISGLYTTITGLPLTNKLSTSAALDAVTGGIAAALLRVGTYGKTAISNTDLKTVQALAGQTKYRTTQERLSTLGQVLTIAQRNSIRVRALLDNLPNARNADDVQNIIATSGSARERSPATSSGTRRAINIEDFN